MKHIIGITVFFTLALLTSCCMGPKHCLPQLDLSEDWHEEECDTLFSSSNPLHLGELFEDPLLSDYLQCIVDMNYDIRIAAAKISEAFSLRQISVGKYFPQIDNRIAYNRSKPAGGALNADIFNPQGGGALTDIPLNIKQQNFIADFDALWELDLFCRRKKEVESATFFMQMKAATYHGVIVSLTSEFTRTYLELRRLQHILYLEELEIDLVKNKEQADQDRLSSGLDAEFTLLNDQVTLDYLYAETAFYKGEIRALIYRLSVMLGQTPESLIKTLSIKQEIPKIKKIIPIGFPSDLLRRRPDICFAEKEMAKATADLGVAIADLFPRVTLLGNYGYQNLHLGRSRGSGESWGYGGGLLTPLFHGGSLKANIERNRWIHYEASLAYEKTVLAALEESESAIAKFQKSQKALQNKKDAYIRNQQILGHTQKLYRNGLANRIQLIGIQINSIQAEKEWISAMIDSEIELVALYKSLGGAWTNNLSDNCKSF